MGKKIMLKYLIIISSIFGFNVRAMESDAQLVSNKVNEILLSISKENLRSYAQDLGTPTPLIKLDDLIRSFSENCEVNSLIPLTFELIKLGNTEASFIVYNSVVLKLNETEFYSLNEDFVNLSEMIGVDGEFRSTLKIVSDLVRFNIRNDLYVNGKRTSTEVNAYEELERRIGIIYNLIQSRGARGGTR